MVPSFSRWAGIRRCGKERGRHPNTQDWESRKGASRPSRFEEIMGGGAIRWKKKRKRFSGGRRRDDPSKEKEGRCCDYGEKE